MYISKEVMKGIKLAHGEYTIVIKTPTQRLSTQAKVLANPLFEATDQAYQEYHAIKFEMEKTFNEMQMLINTLAEATAISHINCAIGHASRTSCNTSRREKSASENENLGRIDGARKSKAYDDVENFPNKFNADSLYLINQSESVIPKVTQPVKDLWKEYQTKWQQLKTEGNQILNQELPAFNKKLWEAGVGGIWTK